MNKTFEDFVTIYFEGLMICCFNSDEERFETAVVRRVNHDFSVRVVKYDGENKLEDNEYTNIPNENILFEFEGKGNPQVYGFSSFQTGNFERLNEDLSDPKDMRWLVDLEGEEFYNSMVEPTGESFSKHNMALNKVYVKNAEFFVEQLTHYVTDKILEDGKGKELSRELFGKYGYVLSAKINADDVLMNFGGSEIPKLEVNRSDGFTYKVFITNTREGGDEENELPVYYRIVKHQSDTQFNLEKNEDMEVELYNRYSNCGKIFLSKTKSVDKFS